MSNNISMANSLKDLGSAKYYLGIEIHRTTEGMYLSQRKYILDILQETGLVGAKPSDVPLPKGTMYSVDDGNLLADPAPYRRLLGKLLYLNCTRPDISFAVNHLSQFVQKPCENHWEGALQIVRYLKGSLHYCLHYTATSNLQIKAYSDADWGSCKITRRSVTGYCVYMDSNLISWRTKKQHTVSRSSAESEYRGLAAVVCELLWISYLLKDFWIVLKNPIPLWCDSNAAIHIATNPVFHDRTKHIEIDCHLVRDKLKSGFIELRHVYSSQQPADILTKNLASPMFSHLLPKLSLVLPNLNLRRACSVR